MRRLGWTPIAVAALLLLAYSHLILHAAPEGTGQAAPGVERLREGTALAEQMGRFQPTGDRMMFYAADGERRFGVLENLNLERVARLVGETPDPLEWSVS